MVERAVRPMVEAIVANAPSGWTHAVLRAGAGRGGTSVTGGYAGPGDQGNAVVPHLRVELTALAQTLREDRGWDPVSLEIRCRASGEYRLVAFDGSITWVTGTGSGFQVVLDPGYRLPQPGLRQEPGTAPPAGDPELAVARFRAYLERRAAILGQPEELPPPATSAALDEAERRLGRRLPADLRALYAIADGDGDDEGDDYENRYLFQGNAWLSLESLVAEHTGWSQRPWYGWDLNGTPSSSTPVPPIPYAAAEATPAGCASPPARTATSWRSTRPRPVTAAPVSSSAPAVTTTTGRRTSPTRSPRSWGTTWTCWTRARTRRTATTSPCSNPRP